MLRSGGTFGRHLRIDGRLTFFKEIELRAVQPPVVRRTVRLVPVTETTSHTTTNDKHLENNSILLSGITSHHRFVQRLPEHLPGENAGDVQVRR